MRDVLPIDELRLIVRNFNEQVPDGFAHSFSLVDLVKLHRAWLLSGWDVPPHEWSERQLDEALYRGWAPCFDDSERPIYPPERQKVAPLLPRRRRGRRPW